MEIFNPTFRLRRYNVIIGLFYKIGLEKFSVASRASHIFFAFLISVLCLGCAAPAAFADTEAGAADSTTQSTTTGTTGAADTSGTSGETETAGTDTVGAAGSSDETGTSGAAGTDTVGAAGTTGGQDSTSATTQPEKPAKPIKAGWNQKDDGAWFYYANATAAPTTGWIKSGRSWYWLAPEKGGEMAANQWIQDAEKWYWLDANGKMKTGWVHDGTGWYYTNKSGARIMGGWIKSGRSWYWLLPESQGLMAANQCILDKEKHYWLGDSGAMAKGWVQIGADWYYATKSGDRVLNGWIKSGGKWYWLQGDLEGEEQGRMFASGLKTIEGAQYSFDGNGAMQKNCRIELGANEAGETVAGYAVNSGEISPIGLIKEGNLVLINAEGAPLSGWQKLAGKWFYGEAETGVAKTGWYQEGSIWYWFDDGGAMATGTRVIQGKAHLFAGSGRWLGSDNMATLAQGYSSASPWLILVDRGAHRVGVFNGSKGNWNRVHTWSCVTGAPGSPTITGVFRTNGYKRDALSSDTRALYCTNISGGYFFHSILASESELGKSLSHGCIRLAYANAQWIHANIGAGTTVAIYN